MIVACVIHLPLARNIPVEVSEHNDVDGHSAAVERHSAIASASASSTIGTLPFPASGDWVNNDTLKDAGEYITASCGLHV